MTDQVRPSAPPLNNRRRRSSATNDDGDGEAGPDNARSAARRSRQQQTGDNIGGQQQQRRRNNNNRDSRDNGSRRQPPVELAMTFHTATDLPLPPPPPISAASSSSSRRLQSSASASSTRRAPSVGTNQPQSQTQGQTKKTKKRSSQTSGVSAEEGMETPTASRSNSRTRSARSSRPPSRSSSGIQEDEAEDITASNASLTQLVAEANATEAELERRRSRLAEIRQRSDASQYELTIQEEAKKIRRLQKTQRKLKERIMRMQQRQQNLDDEAPLDFSEGPPTANQQRPTNDKKNKQKTKTNRAASRAAANVTTAAAVGRGSGSSQSEEAIVRRSSSRLTTDSSGTGITNGSSKRSKNRNNTSAGNQSSQSQQQRQNSATIAAVPAAAATYAGSARSSMAADEALARKLQNEMLKEQEAVRAMEQQFQDEEMARSLAAAEAARMTSLGLSPNDMLDDGNSGRGRSSRGGGCCNTVHRMISCVIMAGCIGVVLFVLFGIVYRSAGGDVESLPPWFRDSWGQGWEGDYGGQNANSSDFQRWRIGRDKKGLKLTLINGLTDDWHNHFYQAIEDWNGATALQLTTVPDNDGPPCEKHTRGMVKTCNGDYGRTDWTG